jgi:hypothetical protein
MTETTETTMVPEVVVAVNEVQATAPVAEVPATVEVAAEPTVTVTVKPAGKRGRPAFTEAQKAFQKALWTKVVFGMTKAEARKEINGSRAVLADKACEIAGQEKAGVIAATDAAAALKEIREQIAVLNSADRSVNMRSRMKIAKPEAVEAPKAEVAVNTEVSAAAVEAAPVEQVAAQ